MTVDLTRETEKFTELIADYPQEEQSKILSALNTAEHLHEGQARESGDPYVIHPLYVATILANLKMDPQTLIAAMLHDVLEDTDYSKVDLRRDFGREVESLVNGVTKISLVKAKSKSIQETETIRKMLFAMVKDIRVILIKLADKLHNMRTLEYKRTERRKAIASECLDIYAPLAGRLGISWMKDELQDLSLKHLQPAVYQQINTFINKKQELRQDYLHKVETGINNIARQEGLEVTVETRIKHYYSIYLKMKRKNKNLDEIFDFLGIRILCNNQNDCYSILGLVHQLWLPIEGRFKDYIAMPKANNYQSLHTTVMSFGRLIEIQIRTHEMHRTAEYGVAAHWLYKQGRKAIAHDNVPEIIHRVKQLGGVKIPSNEFLDEIKREVLKDSIYVFTPKGDVIKLPKGATAIDFAYHIHTEVGHHTMAAKADGAIVPLREELKNTQVIEILTSPNSHPNLNWLRYVHTSSARQKIRQWLNRHDENLIIDRNIVAKKQSTSIPPAKPRSPTKPEQTNKKRQDTSKVGIRIGNERNIMIRFAHCCNPSTGDRIIGYVSRGRGIIVHRADCPNLNYIDDLNERSIEVEWESVSPKETRRFKVVAKETLDLFSEIEGAIRKYKGHLLQGKVEDHGRGTIEANFTMELERDQNYKAIIKRIRGIPAVIKLREIQEPQADTLASGV